MKKRHPIQHGNPGNEQHIRFRSSQRRYSNTAHKQICAETGTHLDFDLIVDSTENFNGAIRSPLSQITGTIHFRSIIVRQNRCVSQIPTLSRGSERADPRLRERS